MYPACNHWFPGALAPSVSEYAIDGARQAGYRGAPILTSEDLRACRELRYRYEEQRERYEREKEKFERVRRERLGARRRRSLGMADGNDQVAAIFAGGWVVDKERVGMVVVEVRKRHWGNEPVFPSGKL